MSDTDKAAKVLKEHGVAVSITEVVGISIPDVTGAFAKVVKLLSDAGENVEYAYAFLTPEEGHAYVIFRVDNNEKACEHLKENGVDLLICGGIGGGAKNVLAEAGIELVSDVSGKIEAAVEGYLAGRIHDNPEAECDHHEHHHDEGESSCRGCGGHSCH